MRHGPRRRSSKGSLPRPGLTRRSGQTMPVAPIHSSSPAGRRSWSTRATPRLPRRYSPTEPARPDPASRESPSSRVHAVKLAASGARGNAASEASVDVDPVDLEDGCFQAARRVVGRAALIGGCLGPDAKVVPSALQDASALVLGDVLISGPVVPGGDADLASVGGLDDDTMVADRVGGCDSLESRELLPIENSRTRQGLATRSRCTHRNSLLNRGKSATTIHLKRSAEVGWCRRRREDAGGDLTVISSDRARALRPPPTRGPG